MKRGQLLVVLLSGLMSLMLQAKEGLSSQCHSFTLVDWQLTCPKEVFCFKHPKTFQTQDVIAIDSLSGTLEEKQWVLQYDVGQYINDYSHVKVINRRRYSVAAGEGELIIMVDKVAFIIDNILPSAPLLLEMSHKPLLSGKVKGKGALDIPLAKCIFSTITQS
ncbi:hypothetical protein [Thalassotalea sp. PP2-459]|uniref:hypothetical protein n=1 Tax=Thalassotalea sp. PP2-459 TaxID=1742724 RepID=UPI00095B7BEC|nr:hypothetical protein [Thalassotalea sp. PP2-459]OKY27385.1 hypothetical protein BI291_00750 [Thalassotalea sp. PP2-459]